MVNIFRGVNLLTDWLPMPIFYGVNHDWFLTNRNPIWICYQENQAEVEPKWARNCLLFCLPFLVYLIAIKNLIINVLSWFWLIINCLKITSFFYPIFTESSAQLMIQKGAYFVLNLRRKTRMLISTLLPY